MALADVGILPWPGPPTGAYTLGGTLIDAADEIAAGAISVPRTGTVTHVHFRTTTVTTGATLDVRLETLNASGQPSGTLWGTNTNASQAVADTDDNVWFRAALTASASVTIGDELAVVVKNPNASPGNLNIARPGGWSWLSTPGFPYLVNPLATNKGDQLAPVICALEYDDGSFAVPVNAPPIHNTSSVTLSTSTNPDEAAVYFTPLFKCRAVGWWMTASLAAGGDFRVSLYEDGNNTPLLTRDYDGDYTTSTGSRTHSRYFGGSQVLTPGTTYRLGLVPLTTNSVTISFWEVNSSYLGLLDTQAGRSSMHYSARNRSGTTDPDTAAWTQTTNRRLQMGLVLDQLDDGAGGGGGGVGILVGGGIAR